VKDFAALPSAKVRFVEADARLVNELPEGNEWLYEVTPDGYRCLAGKGKNQVTLWSRRKNLFTKQFPRIAQVCEELKPDTLLDGEMVALDKNGRPSFNLLQHHRSQASAIHYYEFDLLIYRGKSILTIPLEQRRELLAEALGNIAASSGPVRLSEVFKDGPTNLVAAAKDLGFERIVAKRRDSLYESGKRTGAWVKYKVNRGQEFVIGGYTPDNPFDALIIGYYEGDRLLYAAKVSNGVVPQLRRNMAIRFKELETDICPFANLPERKQTQWA
jgi:ATP-dependent DNA ligase